MSAYTLASEVLLRHAAQFEDRHVLFAGDLQDNLPAHLTTASSRVHTQQYHRWQSLSQLMGERAAFSLFATAEQTAGCDTLIYYWPKNKPEAVCQLTNLLSLLPAGCDIFIAGENRSGVRSAEALLNEVVSLDKIDSARRCGLYHGRLERPPAFAPGNYYQEYTSHSLTIKTLPGVFSRDGLDAGSALLLSTLPSHSKGKVLDIGCGAGVIAATLKQRSPKVRLWLCDVNAAALAASKATLEANQLEGEVLASNVFSDISGRFDMIVSNPPFHEGLQTSLQAANALIRGAARHLNTGGELRIVANAFLPYPQALEENFGHFEILAQTGRFRVYRSVWGRNQTR